MFLNQFTAAVVRIGASAEFGRVSASRYGHEASRHAFAGRRGKFKDAASKQAVRCMGDCWRRCRAVTFPDAALRA